MNAMDANPGELARILEQEDREGREACFKVFPLFPPSCSKGAWLQLRRAVFVVTCVELGLRLDLGAAHSALAPPNALACALLFLRRSCHKRSPSWTSDRSS